eukprot:2017075-Prymnesium_polylepis.1
MHSSRRRYRICADCVPLAARQVECIARGVYCVAEVDLSEFVQSLGAAAQTRSSPPYCNPHTIGCAGVR